jgi:hypothetical protein
MLRWVAVRLAALVLAALAAPRPARAWSDVPVPPDLLDARTYGGIRGILELDGQNVHNVGDVWLHVTNFGLIGSQPGAPRPWSGAPSALWPAGGSTEYLWSAGLWVGALKHGVPHVTTGQYEMEFRPGLGVLDRIYSSRELAPGGARAPAANADDDGDARVDEDWLDGRDNDADGRIDEDFAAVSSQMFVCEYGDTHHGIQLAYPEHEPLGLRVCQTSMAWEDPRYDDFIAFDFRVVNVGTELLEQVYVGLFADADIGPRRERAVAQDDMAGFWEGEVTTFSAAGTTSRVPVSIGYMWDRDFDDRKSQGYIGLMFLGAASRREGSSDRVQMRNFRAFSGSAAFSAGGDPRNDAERYSVLEGSARFSLPPTGRSQRPTQSTRVPGDYRMVVSAGPFALVAPGDTVEFQSAIVLGRLFEGLQQNAAQAQLTYSGGRLDCDDDPSTGTGGREALRCAPEYAGLYFPQRGSGEPGGRSCDPSCEQAPRWDRHCWAQVPNVGCVWVDADCDSATGISGAECLIRWLVGTPPPPPRMRVVASEERVDLYWDNRSETVPDPRSGQFDFESYRVWRADNWRRPLGSSARIGPGADLWMMLGEFDVARNGVGSDTGLEAIRHEPTIPPYAVEYYREWFHAHPLLRPPMLPGFTPDQLDTAQAMARGVRYYHFVDPPFTTQPSPSDPPCEVDRDCPPLGAGGDWARRRCDARRRCRPTAAAPIPGVHYFYSVTATDHALEPRHGGWQISGTGLQGDPQTNFVHVEAPSRPLQPGELGAAGAEIYVVPNPATRRALDQWRLHPSNVDPTGDKIEFRHLPAATGVITIFTLAGDRVQELRFDARSGDGSARWNLVSRNGQDVASGVYLYAVESDDRRFERVVGRFVVVR